VTKNWTNSKYKTFKTMYSQVTSQSDKVLQWTSTG